MEPSREVPPGSPAETSMSTMEAVRRKLNERQKRLFDRLYEIPSTFKELLDGLHSTKGELDSDLRRLEENGVVRHEIVKPKMAVYYVRPEHRIEAVIGAELRKYAKMRKAVDVLVDLAKDEDPKPTSISSAMQETLSGAGLETTEKMLRELSGRGLVSSYNDSHFHRYFIPFEAGSYEMDGRWIVGFIETVLSNKNLQSHSFDLPRLVKETGSKEEHAAKVVAELKEKGLAEMDGEKYLFRTESYQEFVKFGQSLAEESRKAADGIADSKMISMVSPEAMKNVMKVTATPARFSDVRRALGIKNEYFSTKVMDALVKKGVLGKRSNRRMVLYYQRSEQNEFLADLAVDHGYTKYRCYKTILFKGPQTFPEIRREGLGDNDARVLVSADHLLTDKNKRGDPRVLLYIKGQEEMMKKKREKLDANFEDKMEKLRSRAKNIQPKVYWAGLKTEEKLEISDASPLYITDKGRGYVADNMGIGKDDSERENFQRTLKTLDSKGKVLVGDLSKKYFIYLGKRGYDLLRDGVREGLITITN